MPKTIAFLLLLSLALFVGCEEPAKTNAYDYDICVYGGSSAGVIAAYAAAKMGKTVLLISPDLHLGGLSSGGLGATDIGNKYAVTGLSRDFYRRLGDEYDRMEAWTFEPHKAEKVFQDYIREANVEVWYEHRLTKLRKKGTEIQEITVEDASQPDFPTRSVKARQFIDATYVGDLLAMAGVSYIAGREPNSTYNETLSGVQLLDKHQFPPNDEEPYHIDPYRIEGDSSSGLCWGISPEPLAEQGSGDDKIQAYNYRLCLTQDTTNQVPFERPADYDSTKYELLKRVIQARDGIGWQQKLGWFYLRIVHMPNGKTDVNNKGPLSTDMIGMNYDYPEGSYERRAEIEADHESYIRGLLYFLSHDPGVTPDIRAEMSSWGWAKDEFTDNNYFPYKLYIREARRMIGEYVMTEHHCLGDSIAPGAIGMAAYTMDSHNCQRVVVHENGKAMVRNEGDVQVGGFPPYPIAYHALTPKQEECTNLLVPVCLSASHIAYGSIRMEPVFMVLAQTAAVAASMAIDQRSSVQEIDIPKLQKKLEEDPYLDGTLPDILSDNEDEGRAIINGNWEQHNLGGRYKKYALITNNEVTGASAEFLLPVERSGRYKVAYYIPQPMKPAPWADSIHIQTTYGEEKAREAFSLSERDREWLELPYRNFSAGDTVKVRVQTNGKPGWIPADAVLLVAEKTR
ncbi:MAG: FAD-dependent oxidoreductase [Phaeodactylibacter xiamenensis]|uniref:Golvesin/Xly CBD-like domain-containing protein n=1 Tax=Phaeodactylibacter xiamenensis TaxID=1524460 RepID=A0A098S2C7_9BACT|nr:FAD-dependent oxidoreductase [Phaeodactylibacter xiamenensis]KGE86241.1 hypothetical protein IX84_22745 [Phaeodactylibacter xiamenensis]MCR9053471.1 FAD-dependent oxidoreductase [bacterium]